IKADVSSDLFLDPEGVLPRSRIPERSAEQSSNLGRLRGQCDLARGRAREAVVHLLRRDAASRVGHEIGLTGVKPLTLNFLVRQLEAVDRARIGRGVIETGTAAKNGTAVSAQVIGDAGA